MLKELLALDLVHNYIARYVLLSNIGCWKKCHSLYKKLKKTTNSTQINHKQTYKPYKHTHTHTHTHTHKLKCWNSRKKRPNMLDCITKTVLLHESSIEVNVTADWFSTAGGNQEKQFPLCPSVLHLPALSQNTHALCCRVMQRRRNTNILVCISQKFCCKTAVWTLWCVIKFIFRTDYNFFH